jgi:hypothetical protein
MFRTLYISIPNDFVLMYFPKIIVGNLFERKTFCLLEKEKSQQGNNNIEQSPKEECGPTICQ